MNQAAQTRWTRDQLLLALRLYMRTPFGRLHQGNPEIISLAARLGRTPSAIVMKACNFASLDPALPRKGLSGASAADRAIWNEFSHHSEQLAVEAEDAFARLDPQAAAQQTAELELPTGETEVSRITRARRVQSFFRAAVLTSYESRCAISGLAIPELLVASHIIPWSENVARRADPTNGLCLNALFDRAFDRGLITFNDHLRVVVSDRLRSDADSAELSCSLTELADRPLRVPHRFHPDRQALRQHRETIFVA